MRNHRMLVMDRRMFLGGAGALAAAVALPIGRALAGGVDGTDLKVVFVFNYGGWDPTRVFATEFANGAVDMERDADLETAGDLGWVAHRSRPSVDTFFQRYADQSLIFNGVQVPSVAHQNCLRLMMTGSTSSARADWPSIMGHARSDAYALPHVVVAGPSFPGPAGSSVTRTGSSGQLAGLVDGTIVDWSDLQTDRPALSAEARMDRYLERRLAAVSETHGSTRLRDRAAHYRVAHERSQSLKDLSTVVDWSSGGTLAAQIDLAADVLATGTSRCAMLASTTGWDTHVDNDPLQSTAFEALFRGLLELREQLESRPGATEATLADETLIVVMSEMGRTPRLNAADGKDHWPYTSVLMCGPRITGGRVIGGYDHYYYGLRIDRGTGELHEGGHDLNVEEVGATLLLAAGIDPGDHLTGVQGVSGAIAL